MDFSMFATVLYVALLFGKGNRTILFYYFNYSVRVYIP